MLLVPRTYFYQTLQYLPVCLRVATATGEFTAFCFPFLSLLVGVVQGLFRSTNVLSQPGALVNIEKERECQVTRQKSIHNQAPRRNSTRRGHAWPCRMSPHREQSNVPWLPSLALEEQDSRVQHLLLIPCS